METNNFETQAIRTQISRTRQQEHSSPLFLTSSFVFQDAEEGASLFEGNLKGNIYSRFSNPNTQELIDKLVLLEQAEDGIVLASGMAAVYTSFAALLKPGDHVVVSQSIFGNSKYILNNYLNEIGIEHQFVPINDLDAWKNAIQPNTKMFFLETPANPTLEIADLESIGQLSKNHNIIFSVDNCFATPYLQKPLSFGADLVIHSATKYLDGQGRVLGGAIVGTKELIKPCYEFLRRTGASLSPFNAWIISKSLETLAVRMDRHSSNALALAKFLNKHKSIVRVHYPHLETSPQLDLSKKQMRQGGGLVGCTIKGNAESGRTFLNSLKLHSLTANLGDTRSIATHPASTTHSRLSKEELDSIGISPTYLRFSVGLENIEDILIDIDQALRAVKK